MFTTYILPLLIYWLVLFVTCFITVDFSQKYLYDEATPALGLKVLLGTGIFAAMLTFARTRFDTMLTSEIGLTVLQAIAWFVVFTFIFRFQPLHGFAIGVVAFVILAGLSSLAVDSFTGTSPTGALTNRQPSRPIRRTIGSPFNPAGAEKDETPKDAAKPAETAKPGAQ